MFSLLRLSALSLLLSSGIAFSEPYTFEYSGHLTSRHSPGYDVGDSVKGSLTFDTANAFDAEPDDIYYSESFIVPGRPDFVLGYVAPNAGLNQDYVRFYNGFNEPGNPFPFADSFNINDGNVVDGVFNSLFIAAAPHALDWLANDRVTEFNFGASQLADESYAVFKTGNYYQTPMGPALSNISEAYYQLDFARLSHAVINVPEPDSLFLSFVGFIALLLGRRSKAI